MIRAINEEIIGRVPTDFVWSTLRVSRVPHCGRRARWGDNTPKVIMALAHTLDIDYI